VKISYHVSHEQFSPGALLRLVQAAEDAGFDAAFASDHFHPWSPSQGNAGFVWSWLGAALQATRTLTFGAIAVPIGLRYHPAIVAQAIGTLGEMYPDRLPWVAVASGEAINEHVVGLGWPDKDARNRRLEEATCIMRALLRGEAHEHNGLLSVVNGRLWSRPAVPTALVGAALTGETARWMAPWTDGLLTVGIDPGKLGKLAAAYRQGGGGAKPLHLKINLSWARTEAEALEQAHREWRFNAVAAELASELRTPEAFVEASNAIRPEDMHETVFISSDIGKHVERISALAALGFDSIDLHNVGLNQAEFIGVFGKEVLPNLR
jgi:probable non-F420 flavinoid oxidoreductase